jgi:C-terminal processing protease CtpA/Prc
MGFSIEDESVTDLAPEAEDMGLRESDVIVSINEQPYTRYSFAGIVDSYSLRVRRGTTETTLRMRLIRRTAKQPLLRTNLFASTRSQKIAEAFLKEVLR